jgi:uncharacterized damage-inducible protein DinB
MITPDYLRLMAAYTLWQNSSIYNAAATLSDEERKEDRGAFFGSIHETLNHLLWGDQLWLHRFAGTGEPRAGNIASSTTQYEDWTDLSAARSATDSDVSAWAASADTEMLAGELSWYSAAMQTEIRRPRWALIVHFFNHGTHHRGQVHGMLTAAGARPTDTDLPFMPAEHYPWP